MRKTRESHRPKMEKYKCDVMCEAVEDYIQTCLKKKKVPILKEVTVKMNWNYHTLLGLRNQKGYEELNEVLDRLNDCKEYMTERLGQDGEIEKTMAVFTLKQLGWSDRNTVNVEAPVEGLNITLKSV